MAGGSFLRTKTRLVDLEIALQERLLDAEALLAAGRYASTIAMGLYSLEIALKIVICKKLDLSGLPEPFAIHQLDQLLVVAGLADKIARVKRPRQLKLNWDALFVLSKEIEKYRYTNDSAWDAVLAAKTLRELREPPNGVLLWLSKQA